MVAVHSYGSIDPSPTTRGRSVLSSVLGSRGRRGVAAAAVLAVAAVCVVLGAGRGGGGPDVLYYHGMGDPVTWDGVGAGGTGAAYHWTAHSFSPISGYRDLQFTHDHSSWANHFTADGWTPGGVHDGVPVRDTRPLGWLDRIIREVGGGGADDGAANGTNGTNATANATNATEAEAEEQGMVWRGIPLTGYDYFAKMFPRRAGYSSKIFGEDDTPCCNCSGGGGANGTNGTNATSSFSIAWPCGKPQPANSSANGTNATEGEVAAEEEEVRENEAEVKEGEEEEERDLEEGAMRGVNSPMVFNDLPEVAGLAPITRGPTFRPRQFDHSNGRLW